MSNKLHRKCPKCKKIRKYKVQNHSFATGKEWQKREGKWICYWCLARETPDGENKLRELHQKLRLEKRDLRD